MAKTITIAPLILNFPDTEQAQESSPLNFTIESDGGDTVQITSIEFPSGFKGKRSSDIDYVTEISSFSILNGFTETINVIFAPYPEKTFSDDIIINSDAISHPDTVEVNGTSIAPAILPPGLGEAIETAVGKTLHSDFKNEMNSIGAQIILDIQQLYSTRIVPHPTSYNFLITNIGSESPIKDSGTLAYYLILGLSKGFDAIQLLAQSYLTVGTPPPPPPFSYSGTTAEPLIIIDMNIGVTTIPMIPPTPFPANTNAQAVLDGIENFLVSKYVTPV